MNENMFFYLSMDFCALRSSTADAEGLPELQILQKSTLVQSAFVLQPYYPLLSNPVGSLATVLG